MGHERCAPSIACYNVSSKVMNSSKLIPATRSTLKNELLIPSMMLMATQRRLHDLTTDTHDSQRVKQLDNSIHIFLNKG